MSAKKSPAEVGRELFEKEDAAKREVAKKFDPKKLVEESGKMKTVYDEEYGEIKYYTLRMDDSEEISKVQSDEERTRLILHKFLAKAYPGLTLEDVKAFPLMKATRILRSIYEAEGFFSPVPKSPIGSKQTAKPNSSV